METREKITHKMWKWLEKKWKAAVGAVLALVGALLVLLRLRANSQEQKEILKNANDSHKTELRIIKDSQNRLDDGLEKVSSDHKESVERIEREADARREELAREKRELVERERESDDLARKIAKVIGADFVESSNE